MLLKNPKERRPHLHRRGSLKSDKQFLNIFEVLIMIEHLEISVVHIFNWPKMKLHIYLNISVIHSTLYCHKNSSTVNK